MGRPRSVVRLALGVLVFVALGLFGRFTIPDGETAALAWPAAGVAVVLFWTTRWRDWWVPGLLVAVMTVLVNATTGASAPQVVIFLVANLVQAAAAVALLGVITRQLDASDSRRGVRGLGDLWPVVAACVAAALVGAAVGSVGRLLLMDGTTEVDYFVWWARNATGSIVVFTTYLVVVPYWIERRGSGALDRMRRLLRERGAEAFSLLVTTAVLYGIAFVAYPSLPLAFPLVVPTIWVGLRFAPASAVVFNVVICTTVVVLTANQRGAFSTVGPWKDEVLVSQLFIGFVFCLGVLLALGRAERMALTASLTASRAASEGQARMLSAIIDAMHDGLLVIDESGQVLRRNPAGAEILRTDSDGLDDIRGSTFRVMTTDRREMRKQDYPWARAIAGESVVNQDIVIVFEDGSPSRTLSVSASRLSTGADSAGQAVVIYHDVTTDRAQRTALESFAAVVAHDLRGPLSVIEGWAEVLALDLESNDSLTREDAGPKLERIQSSAQGMEQLIEDLLDSSTSREQRLRADIVDLGSVARAVAEQHRLVVNGVPPRIEIADIPDAWADAALVRQLLDNLIGNAIKYVVPGSVPVVKVSGREVGDRVEVTVADEGIGIPAAERDQIFEAFHRAHDTEQYDGHGIGLAVCKKIVERHGGRIAARAPIGPSGTRIVFTLPTASADRSPSG